MMYVCLETKSDTAVFYQKLRYSYINPRLLYNVSSHENGKVVIETAIRASNSAADEDGATSSTAGSSQIGPSAHGDDMPAESPFIPVATVLSNHVGGDQAERKMMMYKSLATNTLND